MRMWAFDTATNQRKLLIWLARLELNITPANWAICRKAYQARPAVALVAEHLKLATGFFESGDPERGFDDTVVNDAEPRRVNLPPDEYKPCKTQAQGDQAAHGNGPLAQAQAQQHDSEQGNP